MSGERIELAGSQCAIRWNLGAAWGQDRCRTPTHGGLVRGASRRCRCRADRLLRRVKRHWSGRSVQASA